MKINFESTDLFQNRHIGPRDMDINIMLDSLSLPNIEKLISKVIPENIRMDKVLDLPEVLSENDLINELKKIAEKNKANL
jgi:glycine dehydrogenase